MILQSIKATGFQGANFSHDFGPCNVFYGPPFTGKTTRRNAIFFALLGYVPGLSKTNAGLAELIRSGPATVTLLTSAGDIIRTIKPKGDSCTVDSIVPEGFPVTPAVLLDTDEYFSLKTPEARTKFVFSKIRLDGSLTPESIVDSIRSIKLPDGTPESRAFLEEYVGKLMNAQEVYDDLCRADDIATPTVQEWLGSQVESTKSFVKNLKDAQKRYIGSVQTSTEIATDGPICRSRDEIERDQTDATTKDRALSSRLTELNGLIRAQVERAKKAEDIGELNAAPDNTVEIARKSSEREELGAQCMNYRSLTEVLRSQYREILSGINEDKAAIADNQKQIDGFNNKLKELDSTLECPFCKSSGQGWKDTLRVNYVHSVAALSSTIQGLQIRINDRKMILEEASAKVVASEAEDRRNEQVRAQSMKLSSEIKRLTDAQAVRTRALVASASLGPVDSTDYRMEADKAQGDIIECRAMQAKLRQELAMAINTEASAASRALVQKQREETSERLVIGELVIGELELAQSNIVKQTFEQVMRRANLFTNGILESEIVFEDGKIGRRDGNRIIPPSVLSGTERLLTFAGVCTALAMDAPFKIVFMDELGRMDAPTKIAVMQRMLQLIEQKVIDQFFGIDVTDSPYRMIDGINVIEVQ